MLTAKTFTGEMLGNLTGANIPVFHERGELTDRVSTFMRLAQKTEELRIEVKDCFSGFKRFKPNTALMLHQKLECFNLVVRHELIGLAHIGNREISRAEREEVMETAFNMLEVAISALNRKQDKVAEYQLRALTEYFVGKAYPGAVNKAEPTR